MNLINRDIFDQVVDIETEAIISLKANINKKRFNKAVQTILECKKKIIITGVGKAGLIGKKISATFSSLGIPSFFIHPLESRHGDLGAISREDVLLFLSNSGNTEELISLTPAIQSIGCKTICITSNIQSQLAKKCHVTLCYGKVKEACILNLAPTTSTTLMLVIGDALAVACTELTEFDKKQYAFLHSLGFFRQETFNGF